MAIYTEGPRLGPAITIEDVQAANVAHDRKIMMDVTAVAVLVVVLVGVGVVMPRAWRRLRAYLTAPVRMPDP